MQHVVLLFKINCRDFTISLYSTAVRDIWQIEYQKSEQPLYSRYNSFENMQQWVVRSSNKMHKDFFCHLKELLSRIKIVGL